ncbi:phospholipase B [Gymnopilus junonius]|uniref:Lysophospholipase n=1 Tax=Gymnopilus junonius TaxID=109634 RepID=A0A9P5TQG7_GYMJU|nr:phospholipase B [Gymnopilus junonius]
MKIFFLSQLLVAVAVAGDDHSGSGSPLSVTSYAPSTNVECPDLSTTSLIRTFPPQNQTLHSAEKAYVSTRANTTVLAAWKDWLGDGSSLGYNLTAYTGPFPSIGIAIPGGGLRAAQYGASSLLALDSRNTTSKGAGTGGLLQVASYISGLSGGSWVTGSLLFNDWPMADDLVFGNGNELDGWLLDLPFVTPDGDNLLSDKNQAFFGSILWSVIAKAGQGVDTSITDVWSRMISYHFLNQTSRSNFFTNDSAHGAGQLWSKIPLIPAYQNLSIPFPIIVADSRPVGSNLTTILSFDSVVYEITPFEIGSYDPFLSSGMNLSYAGTHLVKGKSSNGSSCVMGFDQAGFIMGTSASLFNQILDFAHNTLSQFSESDSTGLLYLLSRQLSEVRTRANDVANWPNPFQGLASSNFQDTNASWLELIDGSSNTENIPYGPLFVKARGLDVIVTLEGSADDPINNWPNGSSLIASSDRQQNFLQITHQKFPPIPSTPEEFIATGVNARPAFFGCDPSSSEDYPLIIYLPNAPPLTGSNPVTNTPTFQLSYTQLHTHLFFDQVYFNLISGFTPNANIPDPNWGKCLQCAAFDRARLKAQTTIPRSSFCSQCFSQYCYNPQDPPSKAELPNRKLVFVDPDPQGFAKVETFFSKNKFKLIGGFLGLLVFIGVLSYSM